MWIHDSAVFICSTIWCLVMVLGHPHLAMAQTTRYEWTYFKAAVSWDTANEECKAQDSRLIKLDSKLKMNMVEYFKSQQWKASSVLLKDYWIGVFDNEPPKQSYYWSDCSRADNSSFNWASGEPDHPESEFCMRKTQQHGSWRIISCNLTYQFICEKELGVCQSDYIGKNRIPTSQEGYISEEIKVLSLDGCLEKCNEDVDNTDEVCWAITYGAPDDPTICYLHKASSPGPFLSQTTSSSSSVSHVKDCFTAKIDTSEIDEVQGSDDRYPNQCIPVTPRTETTTPEYTTTTDDDKSTPTDAFTTTTYIATTDDGESSSTTKIGFKDLTVPVQTTITEQRNSSTLPDVNPANQTLDCWCPCPKKLTKEESKVFMADILESLTINRTKTSSYRRKYASTYDGRVSAQGIGYAGTVLLVIVFGGVFLSDVPRLLTDFKMMIHRLRNIGR